MRDRARRSSGIFPLPWLLRVAWPWAMRLLLLSICFAQLPPILPKADDSDNPGATALPVVNVLYTYRRARLSGPAWLSPAPQWYRRRHEQGSGVQDLEEREEAQAGSM